MNFYTAVFHYTESGDVSAATVDSWHSERSEFRNHPSGNPALPYIGYHYLVRENGAIEAGRSLEVAPMHCPGYNRLGVLAICFTGPNLASGYPTEAQYRSGAKLLEMHNIPADQIYEHGDLYDTSCAGAWDKDVQRSYMGAHTEGEKDMTQEIYVPSMRVADQGNLAVFVVPEAWHQLGKNMAGCYLIVKNESATPANIAVFTTPFGNTPLGGSLFIVQDKDNEASRLVLDMSKYGPSGGFSVTVKSPNPSIAVGVVIWPV